MSYLVTGGTGFIGVELVKILASSGKIVIAYDYRPNPDALERVFEDGVPSNVIVLSGDIVDVVVLFQTISEYKVNRVIHLASLLVPDSQANPRKALRINCEGTLNIFEAARIFHLDKVVWASSMAVFGHFTAEEQEDLIVPDDMPHRPDNIYGCCKSLNERLAAQYNEMYGIDTLGIRLGLVYGAGKMRGEGLFTVELIDKPALGKPSCVPYADDSFNWQYVKDVARVFAETVKKPPAPKPTLNLSCTVRPVSDAIEIMKRLAPNVTIDMTPGILGFPARIDGSILAKYLNFTPDYSLEQGLEETVSQIRFQSEGKHEPR